MGPLGLAVALTLRGGQDRGPVAAGREPPRSIPLGTLVGTDEALAVRPAIPAARQGRTQLRCSPKGSGTPCGPRSRKYVTRLVLRRRSFPAAAGNCPQRVTPKSRHEAWAAWCWLAHT